MCGTLTHMHSALFYFPGERLSLSELCAARLDGHLVEVGDAYMPADTVEGPSARATAVAGFIPEGTAAMGPTAAWIHGAGDGPPTTHHVQRAVPRRVRVPHLPRRRFHDIPLAADDGQLIGPVLVTTPVRTLCDLARLSPTHPSFTQWARALAALDPSLATAARVSLSDRGRVPGKRHGLALLSELGAAATTR